MFYFIGWSSYMDVLHEDALSVSFDRNIHAIIHACLNTTEKSVTPDFNSVCLCFYA